MRFCYGRDVRNRRWTTDQLQDAVKTSVSYRQVIAKLGLIPAGGNYSQVHYHVRLLGLDTSHFIRQSWNKGKRTPRRPVHSLEEILTSSSSVSAMTIGFLICVSFAPIATAYRPPTADETSADARQVSLGEWRNWHTLDT